MAIKTNSPHIITLKRVVEKRFGHPLETRSDFSLFADEIERVTHNHLAENTLRRLWGRIKGYDTVFTRTLDVLCQYVGHAHWHAFCTSLENQSQKESQVISDGFTIKVEDLNIGDRIRIGWLPDRICTIEYVGGKCFKAITTQNSTLQAGDTFECSVILKNYPLFVDNLIHGGELCQRYSIGINHGITILEKL